MKTMVLEIIIGTVLLVIWLVTITFIGIVGMWIIGAIAWTILNALTFGLLGRITGRGVAFEKLENCPACGRINTVHKYDRCVEGYTATATHEGETRGCYICEKHESGKECTRCDYKKVDRIY